SPASTNKPDNPIKLAVKPSCGNHCANRVSSGPRKADTSPASNSCEATTGACAAGTAAMAATRNCCTTAATAPNSNALATNSQNCPALKASAAPSALTAPSNIPSKNKVLRPSRAARRAAGNAASAVPDTIAATGRVAKRGSGWSCAPMMPPANTINGAALRASACASINPRIKTGTAGSLRHIAGVEDLQHFFAQLGFDGGGLGLVHCLYAFLRQVVLPPKIFHQHSGENGIFLIHVHVNHLIGVTAIVTQVVLNGIDLVVDVMLPTSYFAGKSAPAVIHRDDVRIKAVNQVIQRFQR